MAEVYTPWSLYEKPKPVQIDRSLETTLAVEFRRNDRSWSREAILGQQVYQDQIANLPYHQAFQRSLNVFLRINDIHYPTKRNALSKLEADAKLSSVIAHISEQVALEHAVETPEEYINRMHNQGDALGTTPGTEWNRWFYPKVKTLATQLQIWRYMLPWIDGLQGRLGETISGKEEEIKADADLVWAQLNENRGYGVKNCFYESPLFLDSQHAFFLLDPSLEIPDLNLRRSYFVPGIEAVVGLGEKPRLGQDLTPRIDDQHTGIVKYHRIGTVANHGLYPITEGGDIHSSVQSNLSLREVFAKRGAEGVYELLRLFTLMRVYDLTARAELVDKLPSINKLEKEASRNKAGFLGFLGRGKQLKHFSYKQLLVPRIKAIQPETPIEQSPPEIIQEEPEQESTRRFVDKHHVTWFVRKLPEGYHASESAKELATEHKVILGENETIVKDHWRGNRIPEVNRPTRAKFKN